jgi:hypothetical protein
MGLTEIGREKEMWMELTQDLVQWREPVFAVVKFWILPPQH